MNSPKFSRRNVLKAGCVAAAGLAAPVVCRPLFLVAKMLRRQANA